jgi:hypothetical protein
MDGNKLTTSEHHFHTVEDGWIETWSGKAFHFLKPALDEIDIEDIATALGKQCRYGGHVKGDLHYSVAEHCVLLHDWAIGRHGPDGEPCDSLEFLMHDASEGLGLVDLPRPFKTQLARYYEIEKIAEVAIAEKFGLKYPWSPALKQADSRILRDERAQAMTESGNNWGTDDLVPLGVTLKFWERQQAKEEFLIRFYEHRAP